MKSLKAQTQTNVLFCLKLKLQKGSTKEEIDECLKLFENFKKFGGRTCGPRGLLPTNMDRQTLKNMNIPTHVLKSVGGWKGLQQMMTSMNLNGTKN